MFVLPGTIALILMLIVRLTEIAPSLHGITVTHLLALSFVGLVIDIRLGRVRWPRSPLMWPCLAFIGWAFVVAVVRGARGPELVNLGAGFALFFLVAFGAQSLRSLRAVMLVLSICVGFATVVATEQGTEDTQCVIPGPSGLVPPPGPAQYCTKPRECEGNDNVEPGTDFACERVGWFGTASTGTRVRYRGLLEDPNELAWVISMCFPLLVGLVDRWAFAGKAAFIAALFILDVVCVIMTKSRSGQLSFLLTLAALNWRRLNLKGIAAAAVLGLPLLLLGGRNTDEAAASSLERLGCWAAGLKMFTEYPLLGVGPFLFTDHHVLTAHNSFVLTLAEGGPLSLFLWTSIFWLGFRSLASVRRALEERQDSHAPFVIVNAISVALAPTALSAFFLSIAYKPAIWCLFGMIPACQEVVFRKLPQERVRWRAWDVAGTASLATTMMVLLAVYLRLKGVVAD